MLRKAIVAGAILALFTVGYAVAAGDPSVQVFTYTTPDRVVTIPGETYTQSVTVPTVTVTVTEPPATTTAPTTTTTTTTTAPPPAPPLRQSITGPILFRYGDSYGAVQTAAGKGYDRYGVVVVGYGDDWKVSQLPNAKALTYKTMLEVFDCVSSDICLSGASYKDALAAGALMKHADGSLMVSASGYHLGDIGSVVYQDLWVQKVSARLAAQHLDGVFIDNVICSNFAENSGTSAKYPDAASWRAAAVSFARNVSAQMQAKGYYVLTNTFCYGDSSAASNTAWWNDVAAYPNGMITESFEQNPNNYGDLKFDCPSCSWMGDWKARLAVIDSAQAAGADAWELSSGNNLVTAKYACASFLLRWNGKGGGCGADLGGADPYDASGWAFPIGTPAGAMTQSGAAFYRTFSGGKVIVNPSTSSQTVLGVTLAAKSAYVGP